MELCSVSHIYQCVCQHQIRVKMSTHLMSQTFNTNHNFFITHQLKNKCWKMWKKQLKVEFYHLNTHWMCSLTCSHHVESVAGQLNLLHNKKTKQNAGNVRYIATWCQKVPTRIALHGDPSRLQESSAGRSVQAGGRHLFVAERNWAVRPFFFIVYNISLRGKTACVDFLPGWRGWGLYRKHSHT